MADFDLTFDGQNDFSDVTAWLVKANAHGTALPDGWVSDPSDSSGPDNSIGYAGYRFNAEAENYEVRNRVYIPELGRWMQRNLADYPDGMSLYQYCQSDPVTHLDPTGLATDSISQYMKNCTKKGTPLAIAECMSAHLSDDVGRKMIQNAVSRMKSRQSQQRIADRMRYRSSLSRQCAERYAKYKTLEKTASKCDLQGTQRSSCASYAADAAMWSAAGAARKKMRKCALLFRNTGHTEAMNNAFNAAANCSAAYAACKLRQGICD